MDAGKIHVIASEYLDTGEKFDLNSVGNVTRVAPMLAPTLDTYQTDIFAFACRLRSLGMANRNPWPYEDFFNLRDNLDNGKTLPSVPLGVLFSVNRFRNNTLLENFGLPTFKNIREDYLEYVRNNYPWAFDSSFASIFDDANNTLLLGAASIFDSTSLSFQVIPSSPFVFNGVSYYNAFDSYHYGISYSLVTWLFALSPYKDKLAKYYIKNSEDFTLNSYSPGFISFVDSGEPLESLKKTNVLDVLYDVAKVDSVTVVNQYIDYLLDSLWELRSYESGANAQYGFCGVFGYYSDSIGAQIMRSLKPNFPDLPTQTLLLSSGESVVMPMVPTYFFDSYFKIVADWFINTSLYDPDIWYLQAVSLFHPRSSNGEEYNWSSILGNDASLTSIAIYRSIVSQWMSENGFCYRYWRNDYFTSCFPSPQAGSSVAIPQGSIIDLRNANSWQKLKERLAYAGHRWRDVLFAITGKRTSSAIMDMSEVLGAWSNTINIDSVLQQSESTNSQPLANYAGTGLGYRSGGKGAYYVAEEPTVIIFVANIRPRASYFQGLHRKFTRGYLMDYDIPQLANVGEDVVRVSELYFDGDSINPSVSESDTRFGYQRRYGSFMWSPDEVHGDFRGNLDFWHNARIFGSEPTLSQSFLQVKPDEDNLNRVFAVTSDSVNHFYCHFTFVGDVIRHLPKAAIYDL